MVLPADDQLPDPGLADRVADWYRTSARDLPWRHPGTSPWGVLVSEVMLQQTPVARVVPAWSGWLQRWPTPSALAADPAADALRMWGRLGYPRRALRLHAAAVVMVQRHGGLVPGSVPDLLTLPGVGAYTARAVASFAFGQRHGVVDTNARRVVARAVEGRAGAPVAARDVARVEALLPTTPAAAVTTSAALMELGAVVCTARSPNCPACPLLDTCGWLAAGAPALASPARRPPGFTGTDRQVRGRLLAVLRAHEGPVEAGVLAAAWDEPVQRDRALGGLVTDGLATVLADGRYALGPLPPGEARPSSGSSAYSAAPPAARSTGGASGTDVGLSSPRNVNGPLSSSAASFTSTTTI